MNPTDRELDAMFAEYVARMTRFASSQPEGKWIDNETNQWIDLPRFTKSFEAALPWLNKPFSDDRIWSVLISTSSVDCGWRVTIRENLKYSSETPEYTGMSDSLPRAAVIALLRAHGVEISMEQF